MKCLRPIKRQTLLKTNITTYLYNADIYKQIYKSASKNAQLKWVQSEPKGTVCSNENIADSYQTTCLFKNHLCLYVTMVKYFLSSHLFNWNLRDYKANYP
jgi:Fe-S cluster biosynthesis and repair protein YggX